MEIEKRKQAEEALNKILEQWQRVARQLSQVGLTLPEASTILSEKGDLPDAGPVVLARAVANAIGRGVAKAEVELEMESHIESKNFEITRLSDRLHIYEAMNHEMSQRNQQAVEKTKEHGNNDREGKEGRYGFGVQLALPLHSAQQLLHGRTYQVLGARQLLPLQKLWRVTMPLCMNRLANSLQTFEFCPTPLAVKPCVIPWGEANKEDLEDIQFTKLEEKEGYCYEFQERL
ncbi:hypothetical protein ACLOJK_015955 [Asimina triloba]